VLVGQRYASGVARIETIAEAARARGVRPWIAIKELLAERALQVMADDPRSVLQGGAALHFVYGSPRLSQDVDFVGPEARRALEQRGEAIARAAAELLEAEATWSLADAGRLVRGKVTVLLDPARRIVLPVEAYEVPAHLAERHPIYGDVEQPVEIAADKVVATAGRLAERGTLKTRDLYDLWYLGTRLLIPPPEPALIAAKLRDYSAVPRRADLRAAVRAVSPEELTESLQGVLPVEELGNLDAAEVLEHSAELLARYHDLV
jgi:hypothetical protein